MTGFEETSNDFFPLDDEEVEKITTGLFAGTHDKEYYKVEYGISRDLADRIEYKRVYGRIYDLRDRADEGEDVDELAESYKISADRVEQIINQEVYPDIEEDSPFAETGGI